MNNRPLIMKNAAEDLAGNVAGKFSPQDWELIIDRAEDLYKSYSDRVSETEAWHQVIRDFHASSYWGCTPNYIAPKVKDKGWLGIKFIWMTFISLTVTKIAVVWLGQIYARTEDPVDGMILCGAILLVLANFGYFLWRNRGYRD